MNRGDAMSPLDEQDAERGDAPLGIIAGSGYLDGVDPSALGVPVIEAAIETSQGVVTVQRADAFVFLRRHGTDGYHPPHRVPHHAHLLALRALGAREVVGLTSVGALRDEYAPGTVMVPEDYLSTHPPPTFAREGEALHIVPELDAGLRRRLEGVARRVMAAGSVPGPTAVVASGVYAETRGPRFETRAEVRALARDADVVGMTAASEATLAQELGLRYAILSIVDNWAHGVTDEPLSLEGFRARQEENRRLAAAILSEIIRTGGAPVRTHTDAQASSDSDQPGTMT
ncbi:MAG: 5'-methylthioadenosine phosphorylase [Gemmatimonadales bacterium]|nr:MAG: 5'-methylthioadenosine phosphorylase [Gemmatimonadales bacterium]